MTARKPLSPLQRLKVFEASSGRCHLCEQPIQVGQKWEVEHIRPLGLLGDDAAPNMAPAHVACHAEKTATDVADIARAKRRAAKHAGIRKPSVFKSKWRRKVSGETVLRES